MPCVCHQFGDSDMTGSYPGAIFVNDLKVPVRFSYTYDRNRFHDYWYKDLLPGEHARLLAVFVLPGVSAPVADFRIKSLIINPAEQIALATFGGEKRLGRELEKVMASEMVRPDQEESQILFSNLGMQHVFEWLGMYGRMGEEMYDGEQPEAFLRRMIERQWPSGWRNEMRLQPR